MLSPLTKARLRKFRSIKRAWYSLIILTTIFVLSLFSEQVANDRPLVLRYDGHFYFPTLRFYPANTFGSPYKTAPNYLKLRHDADFLNNGGWMIFPPIPHSPLHTYLDADGAPPHPPSFRHWLGTDSTARDVLARLLYGFRICMVFSLTLTIIGVVSGVIIGGIQGYFGGRLDIILQRLIEIWSALPFLYVVILMGSIYGQTFAVLLFVMAIFQWIGISYYMRGEFYKVRGLPYVQASQAMGAGTFRILFRQILPNAMTPVITLLPFMVLGGISALTALDFLGFGLQPPTPSWGEMIQQGLNNLQSPWIAISAIGALFFTLMLTTFIGEGVRDAFDPKSHSLLK